jgi:hypothetical protein
LFEFDAGVSIKKLPIHLGLAYIPFLRQSALLFHAVTAAGFELKVALFVLACSVVVNRR